MPIKIAQEHHADEVLNSSPFALLVGMMLDQQYPMDAASRLLPVKRHRIQVEQTRIAVTS